MSFVTTCPCAGDASCSPHSCPCSGCLAVQFGDATSEFETKQVTSPGSTTGDTERGSWLPRRGGRFCKNPVGWDEKNISIRQLVQEKLQTSQRGVLPERFNRWLAATCTLPVKLPNDKGFVGIVIANVNYQKRSQH